MLEKENSQARAVREHAGDGEKVRRNGGGLSRLA
jgi:hypothetical protein